MQFLAKGVLAIQGMRRASILFRFRDIASYLLQVADLTYPTYISRPRWGTDGRPRQWAVAHTAPHSVAR